MLRKNNYRFLLVFALLLITVNAAGAQSAVGQIAIKDISADPENFPAIAIKAVVMDSIGAPVSGLTNEMFSVTENGRDVNFEVSEVTAGFRTALVLDLGSWINNQAIQGTGPVREKIQELATQYIDVMKDDDLLEIIVVYENEAFIAQAFTNDKTKLREAVQDLNWSNENASSGFEGIERAISDLVDSPDDLYKRILFISPGIMTRDLFGKDEKDYAQELNTQAIPFYSVNIPWTRGKNYYSRFQYISEKTKGRFIDFFRETDQALLFDSLDNRNTLYEFNYRSNNGVDLNRSTVVTYLGTSNVSDSRTYSIDAVLIGAANVELLINNGAPVVLSSESQTGSAPIHVVISGLGNRAIKKVNFQVNGQDIGLLDETGQGTFTTTWSFPVSAFSVGTNEVFLEAIVEDELGVIHRSSSALTVQVNAPSDALCRWLAGLPGLGTTLGTSCINSGFTMAELLNVLLVAALIAMAVVLWTKRDKVVTVGKQIGVRVTNVVDRLTNRLRKLEPKARLIAIQGIPSGSRTEFDLFGETPIGRSNEAAELIFDNEKVSRLHCVIHEGHTGNWTIEDKESANGTYVNGKKLVPFVETDIETDALIELGPVEYGGIKFRFELVDKFSEKDNLNSMSPEQDNELAEAPQAATRTTTNVRTRQAYPNPELVSDQDMQPSDPANQKW